MPQPSQYSQHPVPNSTLTPNPYNHMWTVPLIVGQSPSGCQDSAGTGGHWPGTELASAGQTAQGDGLYSSGYRSSPMAEATDFHGGPAPAYNNTHLSGPEGMIPADGSAYNTQMPNSGGMIWSDGFYGCPASSSNVPMQNPSAADQYRDAYDSYASSRSAQMSELAPQDDLMPPEASAPGLQRLNVRIHRHEVEIHADAALLSALTSLRVLLAYTVHIIRVEGTGGHALDGLFSGPSHCVRDGP